MGHALNVLINRSDVYAKGLYDKNDDSVKYITTKEPITDQLLEDHCKGKIVVGTYQLNTDDKVNWICFDYDTHDPTQIETQITNAINTAKVLREGGITALVEPSGSKGAHLWILLDTPISARAAIIFSNELIRRTGIRPHEVFPKQEGIGDGYGSLVKLPLGKHPKTKRQSLFIDIDTRVEHDHAASLKLLADASILNTFNEQAILSEDVKTKASITEVVRPHKKTDVKPCPALNEILTKGVGEGMRNDTRLLITAFAYNNGWSKDETLLVMNLFNKQCQPPDTEYAVKYQLEQNWKSFDKQPRKVGCKSLGKFSTVLNTYCPHTNDKDECVWMNPYEFLGIDQFTPDKLHGKRVSTEGLAWKARFTSRLKEAEWRCNTCGERRTTRALFPDDKPAKPPRCIDESCGGTAFTMSGTTPEDGAIIELTKPNVIPESGSLRLKVWCPRESLKIDWAKEAEEDDQVSEKLLNFIQEYGKTIRVSGLSMIEFVGQTRVAARNYWILAKSVKPTGLALSEIKLTEEDRENFAKYFSELDLDKINNMFAPEILQQERLKRDILLNIFTPLEFADTYGVGRLMIVGDPDTGKSTVVKRLFEKYLNELGSQMITAEYLSRVGLGGAVSRDPDGSWVIDWGILPFCDQRATAIDGMQQFSKSHLSAMREMLENHEVKIVKAAVGVHRAATRIIGIANTNQYPIHKFYQTKYDASFDLGTGASWEQADKFSGADRRRWHMIHVLSKLDIDPDQISKHLSEKLGTDPTVPQEVFQKFIAWAWSLRKDDYNWSALEELKPEILKITKEWRQKYPEIDLAVLGNKSYQIFASYVLASAAMHFRMNSTKVKPTTDDVEFVKTVLEDNFKALEIDKVSQLQSSFNTLAGRLVASLDDNVAHIILAMGDHPTKTQDEISAHLGIGRTSLNRFLRKEATIQTSTALITYSAFDGYRDEVIDVDPLVDGNKLTTLGRVVYEKLKSRKFSKTASTLNAFKENKDVFGS